MRVFSDIRVCTRQIACCILYARGFCIVQIISLSFLVSFVFHVRHRIIQFLRIKSVVCQAALTIDLFRGGSMPERGGIVGGMEAVGGHS